MFLIFIDDMHKSNALLNIHFADDTTGHCKGKHLNEIYPFVNPIPAGVLEHQDTLGGKSNRPPPSSNRVNQKLQKTGVWLRFHKLSINAAGKTKVMILYSRGKTVDSSLNFIFDNNLLNSINNPDLIHPVDRIKNTSPCPA